MPAYEYELVREDTGERIAAVTAIVPVDARDRLVLRRKTVPRSVAISGSAPNERALRASALNGYKKLEEKHGSRFKSRFTAEQIKRAHAHH